LTITPNSITTGNTVISNSNITIGNSVVNSNTITSNTYYGNTYYGNTYYGNDIFLTGNLTANGNVIANQFGIIGNVLYVGPGAIGLTGFNNPIMIGTKAGADFVQALIINTSNSGSTDWVAQGDNGNDITGYGDFGFTGSNFSDPLYTITGNNDTYVFSVGVGGANLGGNLVFATSSLGQNNDIVFATGGFLSANEKMRFINAQDQLYIKTTTPATNSTTGALRVAGGVGIAGNLYVGGLINSAANINGANLTTGGNLTVTNTANIGNLNVSGNVTGNFTGGNIDTSGNVTAGNINTTGTANIGTLAVTGNANITGNANVGNLSTTGTANVGNLGFGAGSITGTGNITGGNIIGTIAAGSNTISTTGNANLGNLGFGSGQITGTGNITGGNIIGTIAAGSNTISTTGNANLGNLGFGSGQITGTGNITGGNIIGTISAGSNTISTTGNANLGNIGFGTGEVTGTGNITGGNIIGTIAAGSNTISTTGNANVGNLGFGSGEVTGTGNITGGNIIGTIAAGSNTISTTGNANVGPLSVTGNANISGNTVTSNLKVNLELSGNTANFSGNVYAPYFVGNISGNIAAPGSNTYVLFNDSNLVNGVANFTFEKNNNTLTTNNLSLTNNLGVGGNANITGNILANGSITTANSFNLANTSTGNNIFSVQDQSGTPVIEMGRIDSNPSTPAIDFHSGSTLVDYDSKIQASSGNGAVGGGNLTVTANYFNVSNNLIANGNANISGNANVTGNVTANNFIAGSNITGANLVSANYFTGTLTTNAQPNVTSLGTLSNLFILGNLGVGTNVSTTDARVTILAVGQTNVYPVTGNSVAAGTDLHVSGGNGNLTRITQDSFGLNTYVAFTGRAAGGTAAAPTQTLQGSILSQFTGRGFSNGSLEFGNNSTGRVDVVAAEAFTDTSRSTNVVIYTTSVGNINPTVAATFDGNGNLTVTGSISTSGNSNLGNSITANFVSVSSNTVTNNLKVNLEFSGNTANFSGNIFTANANLGNVANANYFSGNGSLLTGITFANLTDANTANLTINEIYLQGVTNLAVNHTGATAYTFDQYPGSNPTLYAVAGTTLAFDLTAAGHPFQIQYANGTDYNNGLFHVTTAGVVSTGASAQSQTSGTLYFKIPGDLNSNLKYQCFNHVAMNGNIIIQNANIANLLLNFTGNINANYFTGNGSLLTGIGNATNIVNGNSNVVIAANGNVTTSVAGNANVLVVTGTGANIAGYLDTGSGNITTTGNISGGYVLGNGSQLTGINFSNLADATTAGLTINDVYLQGVTNLAVNHTGATAYTFDQYPGSNPSLYVVAGTTLAFDLTTAGHPFEIQYANGTNYSNGLFHVTSTGVVSTGASAQSKTSGTLYWKIPGDINGTFKYQCQNHVAMVGNIFVQAANIGNVLLNYTGNLSAGNANLGNAATANYFIGNGFYLTGIDTAGVANGNSNVKVYSNANVEISSNGVANVLSISGSAVFASQNVYANANTIQANIIVGNTLTGNLSTAAQPNITSLGSLTSLTVTGDIIGNTANFSGAAYSNATSISAPTQLATKSYVDNQVSTGIQVHPAVNVSTTTNLTATYTPGGTNPTVTSIVTGNTLISTGHNLNTTDMFVPTVSSSGLTSGTPYFVYSVANANAFTLTASWAGPQLTGLTDGTGLSITSNANPGVGAKLTNSGTQAAITIDNTALALNARVLVQYQSNTALNGVYYVSNVGSVSTNWELTRATDADEYFPQSNEGIAQGAYFFVQDGDTLAGGSYVVATTGIIILGTTGISFSEFSAAIPYTGVSPVVVTGQQISLANTTGSTDVVVLATSPNLTTPNIGNATGNSLTLSGNGLVSAANVTASANVTAGNLNTSGQIISTGAGNASDGGGQLYLNGSGNNRIDFNINGTGAPANTTRSAGTKITLYPALSVSQTDYALGIDSGTVWTSVPVNSSSFKFKWYGGITEVANLDGTGNFSAAGNITGSNITTTGQLVSSVATGTAPLVVSSTTQVPNLFAATANIAKNSNVATASSNISYPTFAYANITGDYPLQSNTAFSANFANGAFISTTFVGNVVATSANVTGTANVGNITGANLVSANYVTGTLTTNAQPNITSVGTLSSVTVSGNANVGNLDFGSGVITGTGNINGGNITTTGQLVSTVATGTAPLAVSSNTVVPNLNASFANIANYVTVDTVSTNISYPTFAYANLTGTYPLQSNTAISANLANGAFIATTFVGNVVGNLTGALANGNSNVNIPAANGNVNISAVGNANILVVTGTGANITGTANVTGNANVGGNVNVTSNIIAGNVYANSGTIGGSLVAGTLTTVAQPNITSLGALTGLTVSNATGVVNFTTTANVTLGAVANLKISGGSSGYVLSTDGASNLSWVAQSGGSAASISNGTSNVNIPVSSGNVNISSAGNANVVVITGTGMNVAGTINGTGNITGANLIAGAGSGGNITGANLVSANYFTGTLTTAAQPNITSLGTLTGLTSGGIVNFTTASNVSLGANGNVKITGGTSGYVLSTDGTGNLSWISAGGGAAISNGNSNVNIATANGNVTIAAVGNTVVTITGTGANITGTGNFSGNLSAANIVGTLANGNSNITMVANANVAIAVTGANRLVVTSTGANITGTGNFTGNVNAANFIGTLANGNSNITMVSNANVAIAVTGANRLVVTSTGANITGTANISGNANVGNLGFGSGVITGTGNITGGNIIGIIAAGSNTITTTGNITGANFIGNLANGNSDVSIPAANGNINFDVAGNANVVVITGTGMNVAGTIDATGNITGGNIVTGAGLGGSITGANLVSANYFTGTLTTAAQPNITSLGTLTGLTSTGTINFTGASNVSLGANGNVKITGGTNGQVLTTDGAGNLSFTTVSGGGGAAISNGTSYANITASGGNVVLAVAGTIRANVTSTGLDVTGNITSGNANITGQFISTLATGNAPFIVTSTTQVANLSVATAGTAVTVTGAAQSNITSVGTLSNLGVSGTVTASQIVSNVATGTAPITVSSTTRVANLNVAYANVSDFGAITNQTTGTYYPVFASSNATGNYALAANGVFSANIANGAFAANSFVAGGGSGGNITGANTISANTFTAGGGSGGNITGANTISANYFIGATGIDFTTASNVALGANGTVTDGASNTYAIGYKTVPQSTTASGNFVLSDSAKHLYVSAGVTVPANASVAFSIGTVITVVNSSASNITITQGSGVTLRQTGTANTGNRTLSGYGMSACIKVASDTWYISGTGLS